MCCLNKKFFYLLSVSILAIFILTLTTSAKAEERLTTRQLKLINGRRIPNQYIVVYKDDLVESEGASTSLTHEMVNTYGGDILQTYENSIKGFSVKLPSRSARKTRAKMAADSRIAYIVQDRIVTIVDADIDWTQVRMPWGLDRIDQRRLPLDRYYNYNGVGTGVRVYIVDTGIRVSHQEFGNRAIDGFDAVDNTLPADDCNGHGTHVAGIVGGYTYGVAKHAELIAVRVLGCDGKGSTSNVIKGVDWVTSERKKNPTIPAVANMSLGGSANQALDDAIKASIKAGVVYVVAAGNDNGSACLKSPARVSEAITVGATDSSDRRAYYSNYGNCVDIFAPGTAIVSAWNGHDTDTSTKNGTSMASPHVAGVAALYLQKDAMAAPSTVANAIINNATVDVIKDPKGSPNRLLFSPSANFFDFVAGDYNRDGYLDIIAINKSQTASHSTEVYVLNGVFNYKSWLLRTGTVLHETGDNFDFVASDYNRDGYLDIIAIKKSQTGTRSTEVHVLNGASNYQNWLLHTGTVLNETGDNFDFVAGDYNRDGYLDIIAIQKSQTGTHSTEVHVLDGASNYQKWLLHTGTILHETGER